MTATFRGDLRAALYTLLAAQQSATPTLLRKVTRFRPGGFSELPAAYVGDLAESISYDAGLRWREVAAQCVLVDTFPTENISPDPFDTLVDDLLDRFTAAPQQVANTLLELVGIADTEVSDSGANGTTVYRGATLTFRARIMEGRT